MTNDISDALKQLTRHIDEQGKTLDLLFKDREILEDILSRMTAIESAIHLQRSTATENAKDIKENINDVKDTVEAKIDEVNVATDDKTVIVKSTKESVIQKIINTVTGKR